MTSHDLICMICIDLQTIACTFRIDSTIRWISFFPHISFSQFCKRWSLLSTRTSRQRLFRRSCLLIIHFPITSEDFNTCSDSCFQFSKTDENEQKLRSSKTVYVHLLVESIRLSGCLAFNPTWVTHSGVGFRMNLTAAKLSLEGLTIPRNWA